MPGESEEGKGRRANGKGCGAKNGKTDVGWQKIEDRGQKTDEGGQNLEWHQNAKIDYLRVRQDWTFDVGYSVCSMFIFFIREQCSKST
jgi:hypothetical protein